MTLNERCLTTEVKFMIRDIDDLDKVVDAMDTCFKSFLTVDKL
jgi:hypothetical protein